MDGSHKFYRERFVKVRNDSIERPRLTYLKFYIRLLTLIAHRSLSHNRCDRLSSANSIDGLVGQYQLYLTAYLFEVMDDLHVSELEFTRENVEPAFLQYIYVLNDLMSLFQKIDVEEEAVNLLDNIIKCARECRLVRWELLSEVVEILQKWFRTLGMFEVADFVVKIKDRQMYDVGPCSRQDIERETNNLIRDYGFFARDCELLFKGVVPSVGTFNNQRSVRKIDPGNQLTNLKDASADKDLSVQKDPTVQKVASVEQDTSAHKDTSLKYMLRRLTIVVGQYFILISCSVVRKLDPMSYYYSRWLVDLSDALDGVLSQDTDAILSAIHVFLNPGGPDRSLLGSGLVRKLHEGNFNITGEIYVLFFSSLHSACYDLLSQRLPAANHTTPDTLVSICDITATLKVGDFEEMVDNIRPRLSTLENWQLRLIDSPATFPKECLEGTRSCIALITFLSGEGIKAVDAMLLDDKVVDARVNVRHALDAIKDLRKRARRDVFGERGGEDAIIREQCLQTLRPTDGQSTTSSDSIEQLESQFDSCLKMCHVAEVIGRNLCYEYILREFNILLMDPSYITYDNRKWAIGAMVQSLKDLSPLVHDLSNEYDELIRKVESAPSILVAEEELLADMPSLMLETFKSRDGIGKSKEEEDQQRAENSKQKSEKALYAIFEILCSCIPSA